MSRPMVRIHNVETDEIIDREMNDKEYAEYIAREKDLEAQNKLKSDLEIKRAATAEKLAQLGLTPEDLVNLGL